MSGKAGFDDDSLIDIRDICLDDEVSSPAIPPVTQKKLFSKGDEFKQLNSSGDERFIGDKVTVSNNDASNGYIKDKLVSGTGVTITEQNDGGSETLTVEVNNTVGSSRFAAIAGGVGNTSNKFLEFFRSIPSNDSGFVVAEASEIVALSVATKNSTTANFSIKVNTIEVDTLALTAERTNFKNGLTITLNTEDEVSIKIDSGSAMDPVLTIFAKVLL